MFLARHSATGKKGMRIPRRRSIPVVWKNTKIGATDGSIFRIYPQAIGELQALRITTGTLL